MGTKQFDSATDLITFSRASGGTALRKISYGSELVTNGTFDGDVDDFTSTGTATVTYDATEGAAKVNVTGSGGGIADDQTITVTSGKVYLVSVTLKKTTFSGDLHIQVEGTNVTDFTPTTSYQTFTASVVAGDSDLTVAVVRKNSPTGIFFVSNISVKEVLFDQADGTLTLFNHPDDTPRIEYDANGTLKGLLIEEARTNLVTRSEVTATANLGWSDSSSTSTNLDENALGVFQGVSIASGGGNWNRRSIECTVTSGTVYAATVFYRAGTSNRARFVFRDTDGAVESRVGNEIGSLVVAQEAAGTLSILTEEDLPDNVKKITIKFTPNFSGTCGFGIGPDSVNSGETVIAYGAQLEEGPFATSYIPTSGATATRSADIASIPVTDFGYNQKAGTIFVDGIYLSRNTPDRYPRLFELRSSSNVGVIAVYDDPTVSNDYIRYIGRNDAGTSVLGPANLPGTNPNEVTVAAAYAPSDLVIYGGNGQSASSSGTIGTGSSLRIGAEATTNFFNGHIKSVKYYPRRLSNAQLQEITS